MRGYLYVCTELRAQSSGHRAQSTEHRAQGQFFKPPSGGWGWLGGCRRAMHRAQSTGAQSSELAQSSGGGVSSSSPLQGVGGGLGGVEGSLKISSTFLTDP